MATGGDGRDAAGLRMESGRPHTDKEDGDAHSWHSLGKSHEGKAHESEQGPEGERVGGRVAIESQTHDGLEDGRGELIDEGYDANLGEREGELALDYGVRRGNDGLHRVVEEMQCGEGDDDGEHHAEAGIGGVGGLHLESRGSIFKKHQYQIVCCFGRVSYEYSRHSEALQNIGISHQQHNIPN